MMSPFLLKNIKPSQAILIGLDKITAKSSELVVNLDEMKQFGPLEIKILKCGKVEVNNKIDSVAYMQVKDLTKKDRNNVFIFNPCLSRRKSWVLQKISYPQLIKESLYMFGH
mgnify:CR=1 FL=1